MRRKERTPLDREAFAVIMERFVRHIEFRSMVPTACVDVYRSWRSGEVRWVIYLRTTDTHSEHLISVVHEVIHIFHRLEYVAPPKDEAVEEEAKQFCAANQMFVEDIFSRTPQVRHS